MIKGSAFWGYTFLCAEESDRSSHRLSWLQAFMFARLFWKISVVIYAIYGEPPCHCHAHPTEVRDTRSRRTAIFWDFKAVCDSVGRQVPFHLRQAARFAAARVFPAGGARTCRYVPRGRGRSSWHVRPSVCPSSLREWPREPRSPRRGCRPRPEGPVRRCGCASSGAEPEQCGLLRELPEV